MSMSEGNKLLQELHQRLTGHWYGTGKYKGVKIDVEEVKYLNGWSKDKKRGASRMDGVPVGIYDEFRIDTISDYHKFIPVELNEPFTSADLASKAKIPRDKATTLLNILAETDTVERVGKKGNFLLYKKRVNV